MIGRANLDAPYIIAGWSFRLFASAVPPSTEENRGSAFNSCVAMSAVAGVDALYLISKSGVERCSNGQSAVI
jgi:hypothetical protein